MILYTTDYRGFSNNISKLFLSDNLLIRSNQEQPIQSFEQNSEASLQTLQT